MDDGVRSGSWPSSVLGLMSAVPALAAVCSSRVSSRVHVTKKSCSPLWMKASSKTVWPRRGMLARKSSVACGDLVLPRQGVAMDRSSPSVLRTVV